MPELTNDEKKSILELQIKQARETLYSAENLDLETSRIDDLQDIVDKLEAKYTEQFGE
tara:strand:+ start:1480 stop:1653 length:174 start_codon:yes stop_codon:yes gene_type:complete